MIAFNTVFLFILKQNEARVVLVTYIHHTHGETY